MLQRLIPASNEASDKMRELGLFSGLTDKEFGKLQHKIDEVNQKILVLDPTTKNYTEKLEKLTEKKRELTSQLIAGSNAFFDEQGNMKSMAEVAGALQEAFGGLSEEKRNDALQTIFGTDAMRAAVGLMELGADGFTDLQNKMAQTSGMDAAAERMGNLKGATEILKGVVESLQIQYGDKLIHKLTEMAQKATDFASTQGPALVDSLANVSLAVLEFGEIAMPVVLEELGDAVGGIGENLEKLNTAAQKTVELFGMSSEEAEKFSLAGQALETVLGALTQPIDLINSVLGFMLDNIIVAVDEVTALKNAVVGLTNNARSLSDRLRDVGAALADMAIPDWLTPGSPTPLELGLKGITGALKEIANYTPGQWFQGSVPGSLGLSGAGGSAANMGGGGITNIYIGDILAGSRSGSGSIDDDLQFAFELLRQRLSGRV
jgi:hypothetical protein